MDTSTPYRVRAHKEVSLSPESSPISLLAPAAQDLSLDLENETQTLEKTGISREADNLFLSDEKCQVPIVEVVANQVVGGSGI